MSRGGEQVIPRPVEWRPGDEAPWSADVGDRLRLTDVRSVFDGRVGSVSPVERSGARASAVLAPFYEVDDELHVVVTRRAWHLRSHRGEVSFPGGGFEPDDASLTDTALRESLEEISLDPGGVDVLGELDHLTTVSSDRFIVPFVADLGGQPGELVADRGEVDQILYVPVADLLDPDSYREERWGPLHIDHPVYFFEIEGDTIWGATAAMLRQFLLLLSQ
jgi:8-oxo-dGTP pyrophosphatase MutT (NUDIX family)